MSHQRTNGLIALCLTIMVGLGLGVSGCAKTVIDPSVTTEPAATTTTLPTGTPAELLPRLLTETGKLSDAIGTGEHKSEQMQVIDNLWNAVRPAILSDDGVLVLTFDATIALCHTGERLNHPADADKCFRNLTSLAATYLKQHP